ncbi:MAG: Tad domain-containing protein, partial [Planctomycetia bacterium]|nr:Tad domain-containing protein [Planctomycetia bacterium]
PAARLRCCWREIVSGESSAAGLHADEDGMIALVTLFVILFFLILAGLVANTGHTVNRKIETQNSADASAVSGSVWMARGMNAITATNHVMGEMMAFVVLHEAFGGRKLRDKTPEDQNEANLREKVQTDGAAMRNLAGISQAATGRIASDYIGDDGLDVDANATLLHGKDQLVFWLRLVYAVKIVAGALEKSVFPPTVVIGYILDGIAFVVEMYCLAEWIVLDIFDSVARGLLPLVRDLVFDRMLPNAGRYEGQVAAQAPRVALRAAEDVARRNHVEGTLYPKPTQLRLPVVREPVPANEAGYANTQIVRATYPWVLYHRRPIIRFTSWMIFSQTPRWYHEFTHRFTRDMSREFYEENNPSPSERCLYVMVDLDPPRKGEEPWTTDSRLADKLFTLVGLTHRAPPTVISPGVFGQPNPQGLVAYAQAILYNANRQDWPSTPSRHQRIVGWDTLNWETPYPANNPMEYPPNYTDDWGGQGQPRIKLNWQAKLVPVTRLREAADGVSAPYRPVLQRLPLDQERPFRNH